MSRAPAPPKRRAAKAGRSAEARAGRNLKSGNSAARRWRMRRRFAKPRTSSPSRPDRSSSWRPRSAASPICCSTARHAPPGQPKPAAHAAAEFLKRHRAVAHDLVPDRRGRRQLLALIDAAAREYRDSDDRGRRARSSRAAHERHARLARRARVGRDPRRAPDRSRPPGDVRGCRRCRRTDGHHGGAAPTSRARPARATVLQPLLARRLTPVVPGFIGHGAGRQRDDARTWRLGS